jgi:RNA polymerase sigma-70 factor (ECF subfamily)
MDETLNRTGDATSNSMPTEGVEEARVPGLVERALAGDDQAFGELVQLYHARVYGVVYRIVRQADDAREVAQTTWVKAWQRLNTYKREAKFFTWIYRIAVNTAMDHVRRQIRQREVPFEDETGREATPAPEWSGALVARPDQEAEQDDVRRAFNEALSGLSPEHRAALVMREVEGRTYREIAELQGCRVGTVMSRLFYARRAIQDKLRSAR